MKENISLVGTFSVSGQTFCTTRFDDDGRHNHHGPGDVVYGIRGRWSTCCLVNAIVGTMAGNAGAFLRTSHTALDDVGTRALHRVASIPTLRTRRGGVQ